MSLNIIIRGLCGLVDRGGRYELFAHPGHGDHVPLLTASIADVRLGPGQPTSWLPNLLSYDSQNNQIGGWYLGGFDLDFAPKGTTVTNWLNRQNSIDLHQHHPGATTKPKDQIKSEIPNIAVLNLPSGQITGNMKSVDTLDINGASQDVPMEVDWAFDASGDVVLKGASGIIVFVDGATIQLTNVSSTQDMTAISRHFLDFYDLTNGVALGSQLVVAHHVGGGMKIMIPPVFDCVPPTPLP